jgi:hypothetical protein
MQEPRQKSQGRTPSEQRARSAVARRGPAEAVPSRTHHDDSTREALVITQLKRYEIQVLLNAGHAPGESFRTQIAHVLEPAGSLMHGVAGMAFRFV